MTTEYNLAVNLPLLDNVASRLREALASAPVNADTLGYPDPAGPLWIRQAIAGWLERVGGHESVDPDLLALTVGARHAISLVLQGAIDNYNPAILVDEHTYQGVRSIAHDMGARCVDVAMDQHGMRPDDLLKAAKRSQATVIYVQPTLQNPTTATMTFERRLEIAELTEMLGLTVIEGDVYSPLHAVNHDRLPSMAHIVPHRTYQAGGMGKILGPGLRFGWLLHPDREAHAVTTQTLQIDMDGLPTLWPSIVARWMDNGTAQWLLQELATAMMTRNRLARRIVGLDLVTADASLHAWLPSPHAQDLEKRLLARGVRVARSKDFVGVRKKPGGIRLALGAEQDLQRLEEALRIVAQER